MRTISFNLQSLQCFSLLTAIGFSLLSAPLPSRAESLDRKQLTTDTQLVFDDPTPPDQGTPSGRQRGGASRGPCHKYEGLTALVPVNNGVVWGRTTREHPTLWVSLPDALTATTPVEFVLQDANDNYLYNTRFTAANTGPGLIQLSVPATAKPLEVGKSYTWTLSVYCNPNKPSEAVFVNGTIQRVGLDPTLQRQLQSAAPLDQVKLLAAHGIWHDALATLADLYRRSSNQREVTSAWTRLLQQANLDPVAKAPITPCCTLK